MRKRWPYYRVDVKSHSRELQLTVDELTLTEFFALMNQWNRMASIHMDIRWLYYTEV